MYIYKRETLPKVGYTGDDELTTQTIFLKKTIKRVSEEGKIQR